MIFKSKAEPTIDVDVEEEIAKDIRTLNDCKIMVAQIDRDIMLLYNSLRQLEEKHGILDGDD